jgi:hypothetical protein
MSSRWSYRRDVDAAVDASGNPYEVFEIAATVIALGI